MVWRLVYTRKGLLNVLTAESIVKDHDLWVSCQVCSSSVMLSEESKFTQLSRQKFHIRGSYRLRCKTRFFLMLCAVVVFSVTGFFAVIVVVFLGTRHVAGSLKSYTKSKLRENLYHNYRKRRSSNL